MNDMDEQVGKTLKKISVDIVCPLCGQTIPKIVGETKKGNLGEDFAPEMVVPDKICKNGHLMAPTEEVCPCGATARQELAEA